MCAAAGCDNSVVISAATSDYLSDSADELAALTTYRCVITTPAGSTCIVTGVAL